MNYRQIYDNIISRGLDRPLLTGYYEKHHIVPKCLGGDNSKENIVNLTAREHYICHQLLVKLYPNNKKLVYALKMMTVDNPKHERSNNREYEWVKEKVKEFNGKQRLGTKHTKATKKKISIANKGKKGIKPTISHIEAIKKANTGRQVSEETRQKISKANKGKTGQFGNKNPRFGKPGTFLGKKHSAETKAKLGKKIRCKDTGEVFASVSLAKEKYSGCIDEAARKGHRAGGVYWEYLN